MDVIRQRHVVIGAFLLLVALNVFMLVMMWHERTEHPAPAPSADARPRIEDMLRDQLGFTPQQIDAYMDLRRAHQQHMRDLSLRMRELKNRMFDDVLRNDPAPALSDSLLRRTQEVQNEIERITFEHLLKLKALCTPEQRVRLGGIIHEMFRPKPDGPRDAPPPLPASEGSPRRPPGD